MVTDLVGLSIVSAVFVVILAGLAWLAVRLRRHGGGGSVLGPFEELWHPAAQLVRVEVREQQERRAPSNSPSDW